MRPREEGPSLPCQNENQSKSLLPGSQGRISAEADGRGNAWANDRLVESSSSNQWGLQGAVLGVPSP